MPKARIPPAIQAAAPEAVMKADELIGSAFRQPDGDEALKGF